MEYGRVEREGQRVLWFKRTRAPPATAADRNLVMWQATRRSVPFGRGRRTDPPPATAHATRYPRSPASPACLHLASPTTRSLLKLNAQHT